MKNYEQGDAVRLFNGMKAVIVEMDSIGALVADVTDPGLRFYVEHSDIDGLVAPVLLSAARGAA